MKVRLLTRTGWEIVEISDASYPTLDMSGVGQAAGDDHNASGSVDGYESPNYSSVLAKQHKKGS